MHAEITGVDWADLVRRWTEDYSFARSNRVTSYIEPRGLDHLLYRVKELGSTWDRQYAITGSLAARDVAPFAPARLGAIYTDNATRFAAEIELRPTETGANVLIGEPFDSVVFDRTRKIDDVSYVALSQVAADLLTSPGRGPAEGEELLRWMAGHENEWRI
jgi:hypothetical protein